jgi:C4-dicarboxylate-specific signal transduction histidine kinase
MGTEMRKSGIDIVGDMPWGSHFCLFYETKEDLLDVLISYCKAGLESKELCLWVVAEPVTVEEATHALKERMPDLDRYRSDASIEIVSASEWYLQGGAFDLERVTAGWHQKLANASARGYAGMRVTGDTAWLAKKDWKDFCEYEHRLNDAVANQRLAVLCTYPLATCGAIEILDVVRTHQFALTRRHRSWDLIETAGLKQAKAEIARLNEGLERRVVERTSELMQASEALREAQAELAHANRVATMGQLTASIAHDVNQPIAATVTNAEAALRWLGCQPPDLEEVRQALARIVKDGHLAGQVVGRVRGLIKKAPPRKEQLGINEAIREVIELTRGETSKNGILVRTELADGLPFIEGDRVQLQQVMLNLIINAVEAMSEMSEGSRELLISTGKSDTDDVDVAVRDSGPGLAPTTLERLFDAFYTTKPSGLGLGLSICRSIIEEHGGRLWASSNMPLGAIFHFTVPANPSGSRA